VVQADTIVAKGLSDGTTSGALAVDQAVLNFSHMLVAVGLLWPPVSHRYDSKPCIGATGLKCKDAQGATRLGSDCFCIRAAYSQAAQKQIWCHKH